jgi:ubiquitin-conjugating enzyme E2 D/E
MKRSFLLFLGIRAQPLDSSYYHWQASITGPAGSPYEGGIFYLYLKVPFTYPFDPPEVRFLTRIFHPNISRHGDIGIDSIQQHNWVSGLTIPKVLISIQVRSSLASIQNFFRTYYIRTCLTE